MSFPKGPRFAPEHISDVPGPNSYNLNQESQLDAYKRGAFLEKADRFSKDFPSDIPGPGAYNLAGGGKPESKSSSKSSGNLGDRYAILQRKVEDLERIHNDGKKAHLAEVERLKLELNQCRRLEKQKKQNTILEARIHGKQGDAEELRKAMQSLESRRRDEVRERDRTIADLEKSVAAEKKRREMVEARLQELRGKGDVELEAAQKKAQSLQAQLAQSQEENQQTVQLLADTEADADAKQSSLLNQLEQHRLMLLRAAEEYGRLAAETVSATLHAKLKREHGVLQMQTWRLKRKLANSEGQLTELVNLVRHAHDTNALLEREIRDLTEECGFYRRNLPDGPGDIPHLDPLHDALATAMRELREEQLSACQSDNILVTNLAELYRLTCDELSAAYLTTNTELEDEQLTSRELRVELSGALAGRETLETELTKVGRERDDLTGQLATSLRTMDELKISAADIERKMNATIRESETNATTNKKTIKQLTETVKKSRMAEEDSAPKSKCTELTTELAESDQFQAAYYSLSDEVKSLIARKELAEGEAEKLSKFNAEILGHQNPAQRIMYVDRIRRELAEIKHNLAVTETECESVTLQNAELVRELQMYKSAAVPLETSLARWYKGLSTTTSGSEPERTAAAPPPACFTLSTHSIAPQSR
ncbi:hypothetical protein K438DRAFT_1809081 [Mycena galopus ATCC 62051]|nr:hypothetical protein K438DRAFT_1809081 [Mycena galopus ATCC 62051]